MRPQAGKDLAVSYDVGSLGELVMVRFQVEPREVEEALEALAQAPYSINPRLVHSPRGTLTAIEFPVYREQVAPLEQSLRALGLSQFALEARPMIEEIRA